MIYNENSSVSKHTIPFVLLGFEYPFVDNDQLHSNTEDIHVHTHTHSLL